MEIKIKLMNRIRNRLRSQHEYLLPHPIAAAIGLLNTFRRLQKMGILSQ